MQKLVSSYDLVTDDSSFLSLKILARLGLRIAASISDATHFVTDKFVRTQNMLEAIAAGKPVVTPMWLESCGQASCFMDEKKYILRDSKKEREIGFNLPLSLARACQYPLLQVISSLVGQAAKFLCSLWHLLCNFLSESFAIIIFFKL